MRSILFTLIFGILIQSCSSSKTGNDKTRYFDENNVEISKSKFNRIRSTNKFLDIPGDSINHKKLTLREKRGKIANREVLEKFLEEQLNLEIDSSKPIVIIYYPGKDPCNSTGIKMDKQMVKNRHEYLIEGLNQVAKVNPIYIYKSKEGLKMYDEIFIWHKDPEGTIERLFFNHHYPCNSFVIISKEGEYISYFGEFGRTYIWEATQLMSK